MSDPTGNVFLGVTTADGAVHTSTRDFASGKWSAFATVSELSGHKMVDVTGKAPDPITGNAGGIFATDNLPRPILWFTPQDGTAATRLLTGIAPIGGVLRASADGLLGVGVNSAGTGFSLPAFSLDPGHSLSSLGDQLTPANIGPLDLTDFPSALAVSGAIDVEFYSYDVCLVTQSGGLFLARIPDEPFIDLKAEISDPGPVVSASCSGVGEGLQLCIVNSSGQMKHAYRVADSGSWSSFGDVTAPPGTSFVRVAVKGFGAVDIKNSSLQVVGVTDTGGVLHTTRLSDGSWLPFSDVKSDAGDPGPVTSAFIDVVQPG
ncbi:MAG TPA: hypothetical protein VJX67_07305 [Blastocatellia bacterium]|nr:hypothetical protein [Blastocatellia bacterium]